MIQAWVSIFFHDDKVKAALLLVTLDFIFGVIAAVKLGTLRLSYLADFLRNDILFKLVPYFLMYVAALVAGGVDIVIPGFDLGAVAGVTYAAVVIAWVASILASLRALGFQQGAPLKVETVLGAENAAPPKT